MSCFVEALVSSEKSIDALAPVPVELVVAGLAAAEPRPVSHGFSRESEAAEDGGTHERRDVLLSRQALLFRGNHLPCFDGRDG